MTSHILNFLSERKNAYLESWQLVINVTYANDTPLQPQPERSKRRRQWVGPHENHAGVKVPWSCANSRPIHAHT